MLADASALRSSRQSPDRVANGGLDESSVGQEKEVFDEILHASDTSHVQQHAPSLTYYAERV
jgi:hypothetical protein